jgi:MerR family transcriptional regulator, light-induced transcriptional regulator
MRSPSVNIDGLTAGAVARRLGVAVTTLRTWHQRYDLGPSAHQPGKHRRYTEEDVARLELMQRLTADGVPSGEAARWVRERPPNVTDRRIWSPVGSSPANRNGSRMPAGGGQNLPMGPASPAARGLGRAAMRLDGESVRQIAAGAVRHLGVVRAWDSVLRPVLAAIGERHGRTGGLVEVEHLVSAVVSDVLGAVPRPAMNGRGRVLLACTDEEQHSLPLEAMSAALAQSGVPCRMLGARVPPAALAEAVERTGPSAVVLWSHSPATADVDQLWPLLSGPRRPLLVLAAGPGWYAAELPPSVVSPSSLGEALRLVSAVARSTDRATPA